MKIRVNLARKESRGERTVYLWAPILVFVTAAALVFLAVSAFREFAAYRTVHQSVLRYQSETQEMETREMRLAGELRKPETLRLYRQINFLNSLIGQKRVSLSALTLDVARLVPDQARLASLALVTTKGGPVVSVTVEGPTQTVVDDFLTRLENSPDFGQVTVNNQAFAQSGPEKGLVTLNCNAQYAGTDVTDRPANR